MELRRNMGQKPLGVAHYPHRQYVLLYDNNRIFRFYGRPSSGFHFELDRAILHLHNARIHFESLNDEEGRSRSFNKVFGYF